MLENEKYKGDAILQKSYTVDFLSKKRIKNNGKVQSYIIEENHEPIIDAETWETVQLETRRRKQYLVEHDIKSYSHNTEQNPFVAKVICGYCGKVFTRKGWKSGYDYRKVWQCSERYKVKGALGCTNRHIDEDTFVKVYIIAWNEIINNKDPLNEKWNEIIRGKDILKKYKTKEIMKLAESKELIGEFNIDLMLKILDVVIIYEDGQVVMRFYDGTEIEYQGE